MTDFAKTKAMFHLPAGVIYLDGNSLGPLPLAARARVAAMMSDEWGEMLIGGWNQAGWMAQPARVGDRIGRLIGAAEGTVVMGDTLSIKVYQALASALEMRPDRRVILSDTGNFPSDLYMAEGLIESLDKGHELRVVAPQDVEAAIGDQLAALMLTEVDYRTGRMHDMAALTAKAQAAGALTLWDLAHSAGALPIDLSAAKADFAVGCTYKYLNGGPGAPAFIYVRPDHIGHRADARRHAADHRPGRVGNRPGRAGGRRYGRRPVQIHRTERAVHCRGRAALSGPGPRQSARQRLARLAGIVRISRRLCGDAGAHRTRRDRRLPGARYHALRHYPALPRRR
jgi:kynureninase